jgi:hypothetical protein
MTPTVSVNGKWNPRRHPDRGVHNGGAPQRGCPTGVRAQRGCQRGCQSFLPTEVPNGGAPTGVPNGGARVFCGANGGARVSCQQRCPTEVPQRRCPNGSAMPNADGGAMEVPEFSRNLTYGAMEVRWRCQSFLPTARPTGVPEFSRNLPRWRPGAPRWRCAPDGGATEVRDGGARRRCQSFLGIEQNFSLWPFGKFSGSRWHHSSAKIFRKPLAPLQRTTPAAGTTPAPTPQRSRLYGDGDDLVRWHQELPALRWQRPINRIATE